MRSERFTLYAVIGLAFEFGALAIADNSLSGELIKIATPIIASALFITIDVAAEKFLQRPAESGYANNAGETFRKYPIEGAGAVYSGMSSYVTANIIEIAGVTSSSIAKAGAASIGGAALTALYGLYKYAKNKEKPLNEQELTQSVDSNPLLVVGIH